MAALERADEQGQRQPVRDALLPAPRALNPIERHERDWQQYQIRKAQRERGTYSPFAAAWRVGLDQR